MAPRARVQRPRRPTRPARWQQEERPALVSMAAYHSLGMCATPSVILGAVIGPVLRAREASYDALAEQVTAALEWWRDGWVRVEYGRW